MDDGPWTRLDQTLGVSWAAGSNFTNVYAYHDIPGDITSGSLAAGYIYILGIKADGNMGDSTSGIKLMRVKAEHAKITNKAQYEYWNGSTFVANSENSAVHIVDASHHVRELSVAYNSYANRFMLMFLHANGFDDTYLEILQAEKLTSSWSTVITGPPSEGGLAFSLGSYAPLVHDRFLYNSGNWFNYLVSYHPEGPYNVALWQASIARNSFSPCSNAQP
jgi:hypothetical protein